MDDLLTAARAKWASSGLTDAHAKRLRLLPLPPERTVAEGGAPTTSIKIPYFDAKGVPTKFYRLRYLAPPAGFAGVVEKPQRYAQPKGTLNEVYLPPLLTKTWAQIQQNTDAELYLTEGEFKAACACANGLPCIGLGGVDVWRSSKRGVDLLPGLAQFDWADRGVTIVYDSDAATNPNVLRAQRQLAEKLTSLGARPYIASLPTTAKGAKQGLDDFILAEGPDALARLMSTAPAFAEAAALWEMNEEVAYIKDPGVVIVREGGQRLRPNDYAAHAYAHRHFMRAKTTKNGPILEERDTASTWIKWPHRFTLERQTYRPGQPPITAENEWNSWRGWGLSPKRGDLSPWRWLLGYVFKEKKAERDWFERWLAYPLQHPGVKMFSAAVIWSTAQGTGKTLIGHTMLRLYGSNGIEIKEKDLKGGFNSWAENRQFVIGDEITGSEKRAEADSLKGMITQAQLRINMKYLPEYTVPDCINYYFTSNHPDAFFLEDTDRRFFIHELVGGPASPEDYAAYDKWYKGDGAAALFDHLLRLDLKGFDPLAPAMETASKRSMIVDSKSDLGAWVLGLKEDAAALLRPLGERAAQEACLLTNEQLRRAYDPEHATQVTANGVGRELKRAGFRQVNDGQPVRLSGGLSRLYVVREAEKWGRAPPKEAVQHWEELFGVRSKKF